MSFGSGRSGWRSICGVFNQLNRFLLPGMKKCATDITPVSAEPLPEWS
jgi:hypothetical protein